MALLERFTVRISRAEKQRLRRASERLNMPASDIVRAALDLFDARLDEHDVSTIRANRNYNEASQRSALIQLLEDGYQAERCTDAGPQIEGGR